MVDYKLIGGDISFFFLEFDCLTGSDIFKAKSKFAQDSDKCQFSGTKVSQKLAQVPMFHY
jgi:hypothetical protein